MPTLEGLLNRIALNQSSRVPLLEKLSGRKLALEQNGDARIQCALFTDDEAENTLVADISNITQAQFTLRRNTARGEILIQKAVTTFANATWSQWEAGTAQHFTILLSEVDTALPVAASGVLTFHWQIKLTTNEGSTYAAGEGYGELRNVGLAGVTPELIVDGGPFEEPPAFTSIYDGGDI